MRAETIDQFSKMFAPCGFRREAFYPCYGLAEATLIVSGGFKAALPVVRTFEANALENNQVVDALADEDGVRELVGSGGHLLDQRIVIAHPEHLATMPPDQVGEVWVSAQRGARLLEPPEETDRTFRAYLARYQRRAFPAHRRPGLHAGRRAVRHRPLERSDHHSRPQPLSAGHRADRRQEPPAGCGPTTARRSPSRSTAPSGWWSCTKSSGGNSASWKRFSSASAATWPTEHELPVDAIALVKAGSIPKTSSGKIQRHACRQGFLEGSLETVAEWRAWGNAGTRSAPQKAPAGAQAGSNGAAAPRRSGRPRPVPIPSMTTAEVVLEHVRSRGQGARGGHHARQLDRRAGGSIRWNGWKSSPRWKKPTAAGFPRTCCRRSRAAARWRPPSKRTSAPRRARPAISRSFMRFHRRIIASSFFPSTSSCATAMEETLAAGFTNPYFKVHERVINDTTRSAAGR